MAAQILRNMAFAAALGVLLALIADTSGATPLAADESKSSCRLLLKHAQTTDETACSASSIRNALLGKIGGSR